MIIAAGVVALALIVTAVVFAVRQNTPVLGQPPSQPPTTEPVPPSDPPTVPPTDPPTDPPTTPAPPPGPTGADAVIGYLTAVAAGNADLALRYASRPQRREATLTNAVLAESRRRAPISQITVPGGADPTSTRVRASYFLGTTPVVATYDVVKVGNAWKLSKVTNDISVSAIRHKTVPMKVNGATVTSNTIRLFPGSYAFTTGSKYLSYGNRNVLAVRSPTDLVTGVYGMRRQLTSDGAQKVRAEARQRWDDCLDSRVARPSNCPFRWTDNTYRYINGSVNWDRSGGDPFKKARIVLDASRGPALSMNFKVRISGNCRFNGQRGTCRGTVTGVAVGTVDLARSSAPFRWL